MKTVNELNKLTEEKFSEYANTKCTLHELTAFAASENFASLKKPYRLEVQEILFENYGKTLPENIAWEVLAEAELVGQITGNMPNPSYRKAKIDAKLLGYNITLIGVVKIPNNARNGYNRGTFVKLKITKDENIFELINE